MKDDDLDFVRMVAEGQKRREASRVAADARAEERFGGREWAPDEGKLARRRFEAGLAGKLADVPRSERQEAEWAILHQAEELCERLSSIREVSGLDEEGQGELTPSEVQATIADFSGELLNLARLFREHLKVVDLDDTAKAIGVGGGN